jgi:hypothetical protein
VGILTRPLHVEWLRPVGWALAALVPFLFAFSGSWIFLDAEPVDPELLRASGAEGLEFKMLALSAVLFVIGCAALRKLYRSQNG